MSNNGQEELEQNKMNPLDAFNLAQQIRLGLQDEARALGINEEYISILVDTFYTKVRANPELGPIFGSRIGDQWEPHLIKMKTFWGSVMLRTGAYGGKPMQVHLGIKEATPQHFQTWLGLFEETLNETAPNHKVVELFMERASTMSERLQSVMFK
ncbi:MAG: group III truncated hemoglobin [Armatimonadota bacterium]